MHLASQPPKAMSATVKVRVTRRRIAATISCEPRDSTRARYGVWRICNHSGHWKQFS